MSTDRFSIFFGCAVDQVRRPFHNRKPTQSILSLVLIAAFGLVLGACAGPLFSGGDGVQDNLEPPTRSVVTGPIASQSDVPTPISAFSTSAIRNTSTEVTDRSGTFHRAGIQHQQNQEWEQAIRSYTKAINENPAHPDAYFNRGSANQVLGRHGAAITDFSAHIRLNPTDPRAFNNRGLSNQARASYTDALQDFNQALRLDPTLAAAYANRSQSLFWLDEFEMARIDLELAISSGADHPDIYFNLGLLHYSMGQPDEALSSYGRALSLAPDAPWIFHERGLIYFEMGDLPKAQLDLEAAISLDPKNPKPHYDLGLLQHHQGQTKPAIGKYTVALQLDPYHWDARQNRAVAYAATKQNQRAIQDLDRLLGNSELSDSARAEIDQWIATLEAGQNPFS